MINAVEQECAASPLGDLSGTLSLVPVDGLPYQVLLWRALVGALRDDDIERFISLNEQKIAADADRIGVDQRNFETQIRLHLPACNRADLWHGCPDDVYERVRLPAVTRASAMREAEEEAEFYAYASFLLGGEVVRRDQSITRADGLRRGLKFGYVPPRIGQFYQSKLHYLRSARCDTELELGMYLDGATLPLTYLSFSLCDRPYIMSALRRAGINAGRAEVLVLTRMYGLPGIPHNMMSLSIGRATRLIRRYTSYKYIVTAFNPMLGFFGTTFLATGFVPFATAPVTYNYTHQGMFSTRRQSGESLTQRLDTPKNVLLALGVDKVTRKSLVPVTELAEIPETDYVMPNSSTNGLSLHSLSKADLMKMLSDYRRLLESAWSTETIHPGYTTEDEPKPPSRGQCGVSSVWLARKLHAEFEIEPTYCYGALVIGQPPRNTIDHHCWVEIGKREDPSRIVIDLTCDQAEELGEPVLCGEHGQLVEKGVRYEARSHLGLNELEKDRVWRRFQALRAAVDSLQREACPSDLGLLGVQ